MPLQDVRLILFDEVLSFRAGVALLVNQSEQRVIKTESSMLMSSPEATAIDDSRGE